MMLILKNKQTYQQVIIALLIVLGTAPNFSEGLKCSTCDGAAACETKDCGDNMGACITSGTPGSMKRGCAFTTKSDCIKNEAGGDCYKPEADGDKAILGKVNMCIETNKKEGETVEPVSDQGSTCVCTTDACNKEATGTGSPPPPPPPGPNNQRNESGVVKCYRCDGDNSSSCWNPDESLKKSSLALGTCGGCVKSIVGNQVARTCTFATHAQCLEEKFPGSCADTHPSRYQKAAGDIKACVAEKEKSSGGRQSPEFSFENLTVLLCGCTTDWCNFAGHNFASHLLIFSAILLAKMF